MKTIHSRGNAPRLSFSYQPIARLKPDPKNPRHHPPQQIRRLMQSLQTFGFLIPILVNLAGVVIAGVGRWLAARELGWSEVPTVLVEHLSEAQIKAYRIADNRLAQHSTWDDALLAETLQELSVMELDFSLEVTGFDVAEIDLRIGELNADGIGGDREGSDPADVLPEALGPAVTMPGDLWLCEAQKHQVHRVLCADATEECSYRDLMGGQKADLVIEDPPYNVPINGHVGGRGRIKHPEFAMASGEMSRGKFTHFLTTALGLAAQYSRKGSAHYLFMDFRHMGELLAAGKAVYDALLNLCVWVKHTGGMGSLYRSQHELVFVFRNGKDAHRNNVQLGRYGRNRTNVWTYPGIQAMRRASEEGDLLALHPTVKPIRLVADAVLDCSKRGDIVLDAFLGSGTTLLACQRVGRTCYAMEIDPRYVDVAIRRWQVDTGGQARHAITGETFSARERKARRLRPSTPLPNKPANPRKTKATASRSTKPTTLRTQRPAQVTTPRTTKIATPRITRKRGRHG